MLSAGADDAAYTMHVDGGMGHGALLHIGRAGIDDTLRALSQPYGGRRLCVT
jgi:hypothetical protein